MNDHSFALQIVFVAQRLPNSNKSGINKKLMFTFMVESSHRHRVGEAHHVDLDTLRQATKMAI